MPEEVGWMTVIVLIVVLIVLIYKSALLGKKHGRNWWKYEL